MRPGYEDGRTGLLKARRTRGSTARGAPPRSGRRARALQGEAHGHGPRPGALTGVGPWPRSAMVRPRPATGQSRAGESVRSLGSAPRGVREARGRVVTGSAPRRWRRLRPATTRGRWSGHHPAADSGAGYTSSRRAGSGDGGGAAGGSCATFGQECREYIRRNQAQDRRRGRFSGRSPGRRQFRRRGKLARGRLRRAVRRAVLRFPAPRPAAEGRAVPARAADRAGPQVHP